MLWIPIFCDAPGRFSMTIGWPSNFDASGATMRATMSTGPPGAVGRTRRMGLKGKLCAWRSEEHTSELQSRGHLVCRLLLEKKKKNIKTTTVWTTKNQQQA